MGRLLRNCIINASIPLILLLAAAIPVFCQNQAPTITSLSPPSAAAGGPSFTLTVYGNNFAQGAIVQWNGSNRAQLNLMSTPCFMQQFLPVISPTVGKATVTVVNPGPGGGISNSCGVYYSVQESGAQLNSISPNTFPVGGDGIILTVQGSNFVGNFNG